MGSEEASEADAEVDLSVDADYEDYPAEEKGDDAPDEGSQFTGSTSADAEEDEGEDIEEPSSSSSVSAPPKIDFDKVNGMKKSAIWALVEDQEDALKAFSGMIKARWAGHKKKDRSIRR